MPGRRDPGPRQPVRARCRGHALAGVAVGEAAGPDLAEIVRDRLAASGRFKTVEVRRRYRSLTATDQIALVIVVRERPGARFSNPVVRAVAGLGRRLMVAPIVDHREGYGVAYGALTSVVDASGAPAAGCRCPRPGAATSASRWRWRRLSAVPSSTACEPADRGGAGGIPTSTSTTTGLGCSWRSSGDSRTGSG